MIKKYYRDHFFTDIVHYKYKYILNEFSVSLIFKILICNEIFGNKFKFFFHFINIRNVNKNLNYNKLYFVIRYKTQIKIYIVIEFKLRVSILIKKSMYFNIEQYIFY